MSEGTPPYFTTPDGRPVPAVTAAQMRDVERIAAEQTGPGLLQMSEQAGMALALCAIEMLGGAWRSARVVVLAGGGGNGAGGICAARHLANRGVEVLAVTATPPAQASGALGQQLMVLAEAPARLVRWSEAFDASDGDLVVDAIAGCGRDGEPGPVPAALIRAADAAGRPLLSLDVPSGIDPDSGEAAGVAVRPRRTLTLALPKQGLSRRNAGDLWLADIGIPPGVFARAGIAFAPIFGASTLVPLRYPGE